LLFKYDVLCIGSATVDSFLEVDTPFQKVRLGDKILVNSIIKHSGGGAINSAFTLAKIGLKVKVLTKLGNDHDAEFIHKKLSQHQIKNICKSASKNPTDASSIIDYSANKDRIIYNHKGASQDLNERDYSFTDLNCRWIYLATLMGDSFETAKKIAEKCKNKNIPLLFNPSLYLAQKGETYLRPVLKATKILVLNLEEAQALTKIKSKDFRALLVELRKLGPETIVITNGAKKMYALHQYVIYSVTPPDVKVVHTAGAGDAFTAGLLGALLNEEREDNNNHNYFETALKIGQAQATSVIQDKGVAHKLLNQKEALELARKLAIKVNIEGAI
jgi:ribokinase